MVFHRINPSNHLNDHHYDEWSDDIDRLNTMFTVYKYFFVLFHQYGHIQLSERPIRDTY